MKTLNLFFLLLITVIVSVVISSGCSEKKNILPEEKFIEVYVDLLIHEDTLSYKKLPLDSIKTIVFKKHQITARQYSSTLDEYNLSPEKWEEFFDKVLAYAEKLKAKDEQ